MADESVRELPDDLPTFGARFGTDAQRRAYLGRAAGPRASPRRAAAMGGATATGRG